MATHDLDGYWMARAEIQMPKSADEETGAEIFIAGPPTADGGIEGLAIGGLKAFIELRNLLNDAYDEWQQRLALSSEDIPQ